MDEERDSSLGFVLGVALGVALTLLFTTKKGKVIRGKISKSAAEIWDELAEVRENLETVVSSPEGNDQKETTSKDDNSKKDSGEEKESPIVKEIQERGRRFFFRRPRSN